MKAKTGTRFLSLERTKLEEVIPLDTPLLIFVDPSSACNLKCPFCPCGGAHKDKWSNEKKPYIMKFDVFRKIIDNLADFPQKVKTLRLYKEGEPLLNKNLPQMIAYAKEKEAVNNIDFITNGTLLTKELNLSLIKSGVDRINISIEAINEEEFYKNSGYKIDFTKYLETLTHLYKNKENCHIFMKITDYGLQNHTKEEFYNIFGDICDEIAIENVSPVWPGFEVNECQKEVDRGIYNNEINKVNVCPYIFYSMCINAEGSVSVCFLDWNHKAVIGNIEKDSLSEIWNGKALRDLRISHLTTGKDKYENCANCGQLTYGTLDNIDMYAENILKRMED